MSSAVLILNPAAGGGTAADAVRPHVAALQAVLGEVEVRTTAAPGDATQLAADAARAGASAVLAAGGDGTVFEVVNGLLPADAPPALGVLPVGTGNSFVRDLHDGSLAAAVAGITSGCSRPVDAIRITHAGGVLHAVNLVSFGFSAQAGALTNRRYKRFGAAGYVLAVLQSWLALTPERFAYQCDDGPDQTAHATLLSFCNSRFTGGSMRMAPDALLDDGLLDVVRIGAMGRRRFLTSFPKIFAGTHGAMPEVSMARAARVSLSLPAPVQVMIDGEIRLLHPSALAVVPGALQVLA